MPNEADTGEMNVEEIPALRPRPWGTVWDIRNSNGAPWTRPLNDQELGNPEGFEPFPPGAGRWAW